MATRTRAVYLVRFFLQFPIRNRAIWKFDPNKIIFPQGSTLRRWWGDCCSPFSLCRNNIFASIFYSILWFFIIRFKTYNLWKSMAFFWKRNSYFRIGLVVKNCIFACRRYNDSFLKFCFSHKEFHIICIVTVISDPFQDRSDRKQSIKLYKENVCFWHFGLKIQSRVKTRILKISWVLSLLLGSKTCCFGPLSDRIRLRSLFGRSCLSPDSLFCRTWGPILAHARFWSKVHPFFTFSSFSLFSTAVKIVALVYAKRTSVIKSRSVS